MRNTLIGFALAVLGAASLGAQARPGTTATLRTADGKPDLQGTWTNATITPLERPQNVTNLVLSEEEAARMERAVVERRDRLNEPSDPDRPAPPVDVPRAWRSPLTFVMLARACAAAGMDDMARALLDGARDLVADPRLLQQDLAGTIANHRIAVAFSDFERGGTRAGEGASTILVTLDAEGRTAVEGAPVAGDLLEEQLRSLLAGRPGAEVIVAGDRRASLDHAVRVLDCARRAGAERASLATGAGE